MSWCYQGSERPDWAKPENEILYVLQVADLQSTFDDRFEDGAWDNLSPERRDAVIDDVMKYLENWGGGGYSWGEAISDAINETFPEVEDDAT